MLSQQDQQQLKDATQLLLDVIARHWGEDLRAVAILNEAIQDIRLATRFFGACTEPNG